MIQLNKYGIDYNPSNDYDVRVSDLIALGNIESVTLDTKVIEDRVDTAVIQGKHTRKNIYAVMGDEIVYITDCIIEGSNTVITLDRSCMCTTQSDQRGNKIRSVVIPDFSAEDINVLSWDFEDTVGSITSNLFPCELGSGNLDLSTDLYLWNTISSKRVYRVRPKNTVVYIFKGVGDKRFLKHVTAVSKQKLITKTRGDVPKVRLELKTLLYQWYDKELATNTHFKNTKPLDFFKTIFGKEGGEVYYAEGVTDDSFININNLHSKEYAKISDILKAYCSNGVRFCIDRYEKIKVFSDFKVGGILSQKDIYEDVISPTVTTDENLIYNSINTDIVQRLTMYNIEDLGGKHVCYAKKVNSAIMSDKLITKESDGTYSINMVYVGDNEAYKYCQLGDIVCFKRTVEPKTEVFARIIDIETDGVITIYPVTTDKDIMLFDNGKAVNLFNVLNLNPCYMDLYYARQELPVVAKLKKNISNKEVTSNLMHPLLPKIDGTVVHVDEKIYTFGCASNLKVGNYTGIVEEISKLYGVWDSTKLLYNREIEQFDNNLYPPVFVLSNKVTERVVNYTTHVIDYTSFDNSDLILDIKKPTNNNGDLNVKMYNNKNINSNIDLVVDREIGRIGNNIIQVASMLDYRVGDVLVVNRPEDMTPQEEMEFDSLFVDMKWVVQKRIIEGDKTYLQLDSSFPKRLSQDKVYEYTKYPNWSIVYVQELYFRGNPVIEHTQNVSGLSTAVNYEGDRSVDIYGEKQYKFDSKLLSKFDVTMMMGYILDNYQATDTATSKFYIPISTYNGIDIELLDVITIKEPTYTDIKEDTKWVVLSVQAKSGTNVVQLKVINVNSKDTKPFKIDIKDVLEYTPVDIPTYDHMGGEGTDGDNDGKGGEGNDKDIGTFHLALVDPQIFRAKVDRVEGKHIYFTSYGGTEWQKYVSKLFPSSEFGISIGDETLLMKSDRQDGAFIRKRDIYNNGELVDIKEGDSVNFLTMSYFVDIDGKFYSRSCKIGDGASYFEYDINKGAKFVGDFVVGEDSKQAGNDLWESLQKNRTFQQVFAPTSDSTYTLKEGDMWYDTDDQNHLYRYNGDVWLSCRDGSIISSSSTAFVQDTPPVSTPGRPINNGDTWYDSSEKNRPYVYKDGIWVSVSDTSLDEAIAEAKKQAENALSLLSDISSDNKLTPNEKQKVKLDMDIIKDEHPKIVEEATKFGVNTALYTNSFNRLVNYITPLLTYMHETSEMSVVTFDTQFKEYYQERQNVLQRISLNIPDVNSMQNGKMLYLDPTFKDGSNSIRVYNNSNNGLVTHALQTGAQFGVIPPNDTGKVLTITKAVGTTSPNLGGFYFGTATKSGMRLCSKIVACIPIGFRIAWASNATGNNRESYWVTEVEGTGKFKEYVHVLKCGTDGTFSSTSFFYLIPNNGDNNQAVKWALSYATVFDSGANESEYITTALGNSKIFHSPTAPTSGMKTNDLWYDTDDQNHPYVFNGSVWVSARDKIFETEGGNNVYFQDATPPTSGTGVKDGDTWFKTNSNNTMYVLYGGKWTLASDAQDKVESGRVVINGNTLFNGEAEIISRGSSETTIIKGGSITFTRDGVPITVIRNMKVGTINTDGNGSGYVTFSGMKNLDVITAIQALDMGTNIRNVHAYATCVDAVANRWRFYLYGTSVVLGTANTKTKNFALSSYTFAETFATIQGDILHFTIPETVIWSVNSHNVVGSEGCLALSSSCSIRAEVYVNNADGNLLIGVYDGVLPMSVGFRGVKTGVLAGRQEIYCTSQYLNIPISVARQNTSNLNSTITVKFTRYAQTTNATIRMFWDGGGLANRSITINNNAPMGTHIFRYAVATELTTNYYGKGTIQYMAVEK